MSEFINNREYRQKELERLIRKLHDGASVEDVREEFARLSGGVSANEIAAMEQSLVNEGMPVSDIQRLCDVHAAVFKGSIDEIHRYEAPASTTTSSETEGTDEDGYPLSHPVPVFKSENRLIENIISEQVLPYLDDYANNRSAGSKERLADSLEELSAIDKHYARKENLLFPLMEKNGITAPPQVMWGVDDEIRDRLKQVRTLLSDPATDYGMLAEKTAEVTTQINEMIFKEENIMLPMISAVLTDADWESISLASEEMGYILPRKAAIWRAPASEDKSLASLAATGNDKKNEIRFDAGSLSPEEINAILNTVPLDMTFVDAKDQVKYFTQGKDRIFDRPKTIIGREVRHCHPPKSVHIVEQIIESFRTGAKDHEDFWIRMGGKFVYIRYFAVRGADGEFLGTLEVTQDIQPITELEGEKRLMVGTGSMNTRTD